MDFTSGRVGMVRENHMGRQDFRERGRGHEQATKGGSARRGKRRGEIPSHSLFGKSGQSKKSQSSKNIDRDGNGDEDWSRIS
ncbi:hypothetical protein D8674_040226 [Pyrus ussuriensis x Pyrus communis]|uniref:Uncharacterized protein n=1 Tax=Pyrus ussuriensis x Pyrus communis TaxID=2448454 RepID=A0A5N5I2W4_9ROSA|nr:hypothetical protein D8674_040226 [Pyrus ussuriensis x Pyrus communis]